jgi:NNP family nitrate/nitrite transporter-like MFS transporter
LLSDGVGGVRVLYGVFPAITLLALVLAAEPAHLAGVTVILALGATLGVGNGAVTKLVAERFSAEIGSVSGLAGAVGSLGGLLLPVAQGLGQDLTGSYVFGFLVLAALALVGLGLHARPGTIRRRTTRA